MKTLLLTLPLLSILFLINSSYSQVQQDWVARYNGPGNGQDQANDIVVDNFGNVYVTGQVYVSGQVTDYVTIKYNSSGIQQWLARYNGPGNYTDNAYSIVLDDSGNVYVTGLSAQSSLKSDYATIKYNSLGAQQWVARYQGIGNATDGANSIVLDKYGNVYVTGQSWGGGSGYDYATIKYNSSGVQFWVARYSGPGNSYDVAVSVKVDSSCNVYVTGRSVGNGTLSDYATIKYDSSGVQQWIQRYDGPGNSYDNANSLTLDGYGNVYVTGTSNSSSSFYSADYATIKYNSSGVQQWVQRYNGPGNDRDDANSISVDFSGNVYVTGSSFTIGLHYDYATIKYDSSGVQQWVQRYSNWGNNEDQAYSVAVDNSSNVYVTGTSSGSGTDNDYATIKYNSLGVQQWVARYTGNTGYGYDKALSIVLDSSGRVYVTGVSEGIGTFRDYATLKYSQLVGIRAISNEIPKSFFLSQNYPNPFNPVTRIRFDIPAVEKRGNTALRIYDILGREVATLVNEELKPGTYEIEFDGSNYPTGVYYYILTTDEYRETKKAILIK